MDPLIIYIAYILLFSLVIYFFSKTLPKIKYGLRLKRMMAKPLFSISHFPDGAEGKIVGSLVRGEIIAPLTKRKCAQYYIEVEKPGYSKTRFIEEWNSHNFLLNDETGNAVVIDAPLIVKDYLPIERKGLIGLSTGWFGEITPEFEALLGRRGVESTGILGFEKSFSYREIALEEGVVVTVYGTGWWPSNPDGDRSKQLVIECSELFVGSY